jgi:Tfp pilus assembly protein PilN
MNICLNLLPDERKKELKRKKLFWIIIRQELLASFALVVFFAILLCTNLILELQKNSLEKVYALEFSREEYQEIGKYEKIFEDENEKIKELNSLQKGHFDWANVLQELAMCVSDDIKLSEIISKDVNVSISGKARNRESLIGLKNKIENSDCFSEAEIPLSDIVAKDNIDFEAEFKIEEKCIKRIK